jgi:hypothetical protein
MSYGYIVVINDNASDNYTYGVSELGDQIIYTSYEAAKEALAAAAENYENFLPVAYGSAFPYDNVTFDEEIEAKSFAPIGWGVVEVEGDFFRVCVGLLRLQIKGA